MENAVKPRFRRVAYKFCLIWFLVNSSIVSIAFYLAHHSGLGLVLLLSIVGLVLGLSQGILVRKYLHADSHTFKLDWWVFSLLVGLTLTLLMVLASIAVFIFPALPGLSSIGSSAPTYRVSNPEDFILLGRYLVIIGSVIGGGTTGLLQFAMMRKYVKSAVIWIVATALSGGLHGLIYLQFWSSLLANESNRQNYDFLVAVTSGKIGVIYGLITGIAMMIMLQKTIEHQTRSS